MKLLSLKENVDFYADLFMDYWAFFPKKIKFSNCVKYNGSLNFDPVLEV